VFRKKVETALKKKTMQGIQTDTYYARFGGGTSNGQTVFNMSFNAGNGFYFDPAKVNDVASVLWNQKAPTPGHLNVSTAENFSFDNVVIEAISMKSEFIFKNNGRRAVSFDLYECLAKTPRTEAAGDAVASWATAIAADVAAGTTLPGFNAYSGGGNISNPTANTLDSVPGMTSTFSQLWTYTKRSFVMEPGQTINHTLRGPKDTTYDFSKFNLGGTFNNIQRGKTMCLIMVLKTDLVSSNAGDGVGRYANDNDDGEYLICERKDSYILGMPEQAGFVYPVAPVPSTQKLGLRRRKFIHNVYTTGINPAQSDIIRVDEENPVMPEVLP